MVKILKYVTSLSTSYNIALEFERYPKTPEFEDFKMCVFLSVGLYVEFQVMKFSNAGRKIRK